MTRASGRLPMLVFLLSGAGGLIFELCWIRRASLVFGSTLHATSTVLAVYFLGLALGSHVFGRISQRVARPLRLYAALELAIAALALLSLPAFGWIESVYGAAYRGLGNAPIPLGVIRGALVAVVLLPPTVLLGGTLPLFCRGFVGRSGGVARGVGFLYGLNTLGAAAGCALAGFVLLPSFGRMRTMAIGAALSAAAGLIIGAFAREPATPSPAAPRALPPLPSARGVLALMLVTGFVALGQEVLWTRFLALVITQSATSVTIVLTAVLIGIVLGSLLAAAFADRARAGGFLFGIFQAAGALMVMALMFCPPALWRGSAGGLGAFLLIVPPAALSGAIFPIAARLAIADPAFAGAGVGRLAAFNTLGGILGSLVTGFLVLPRFGLEAGVRILAGIGVAGAIASWVWLARGRRPAARGIAALAAVAAWLVIPALGARLPADYLGGGGKLIAFREGLQSNLAVVRRDTSVVLEIDNWWQGGNAKSHQIVAAHLPMLLHPDPRSVLVVGVGAGQTPARFLMYGVRRVDCVDIEPAVFDLIRDHFDSGWMSDPRAHLIREDGLSFVRNGREPYDVISVEIGQLFRPGAAGFYTSDFYRHARRRLAPGGILSQFVPMPFLTEESCRNLVAAFRAVFPGCVLWYNTSELLLVGGRDGPPILRPERLRILSEPGPVSGDLRYAYWGGPAWDLDRPGVLLGGFLCGSGGLERFTGGATAFTDDRSALELVASLALAIGGQEGAIRSRIVACLDSFSVAAGPEPIEARVLAQARHVRTGDLADLVASIDLRRAFEARVSGNGAAVIASSTRALEANPENLNARRLLAIADVEAGRIEEASAAFLALVLADSADRLAQRGLALALHRMGHGAEAIPHYLVAIAEEPADAEAENGLGVALAEGGRIGEALPHFERSLAIDPSYADARRNRDRALGMLSARASHVPSHAH